MAVGPVNQKRQLIAELTGIARAEGAREDAQAFAHFGLVAARNCCAGMLRIREFGGEDNVASLQALGALADQVEIDGLIEAADERKAEWARQEAQRPKRSSDTSSSGSGYSAPSITSSFTTGLF